MYIHKLSEDDFLKLKGVKPLIKNFVCDFSVYYYDRYKKRVRVIEGIRTGKRQRYLKSINMSKLDVGPHMFGYAVDLGINSLMRTPKDWNNKKGWQQFVDEQVYFAKQIRAHSKILWGGISWGWDFPHLQERGWKNKV